MTLKVTSGTPVSELIWKTSVIAAGAEGGVVLSHPATTKSRNKGMNLITYKLTEIQRENSVGISLKHLEGTLIEVKHIQAVRWNHPVARRVPL